MAESSTGKRPASGDVEEEEEETDEEATLHGRRDQCSFSDIFSTEMIETLAYYLTVCELAHIRITCKAMYHGTRLPRSLLIWTSEFDPNKVYALEPMGLTGSGEDLPPSVAKQPIVLPPSITSNWLLGRESSADTDPRRKLVAPQKVALGIPRSENQISRKQASLTVARGHLVLKSVEAPSPVAVIRGPGRLPGEATEVMLHPEEAVRFRVGDTVVLDTWRKESHFTWRLGTVSAKHLKICVRVIKGSTWALQRVRELVDEGGLLRADSAELQVPDPVPGEPKALQVLLRTPDGKLQEMLVPEGNVLHVKEPSKPRSPTPPMPEHPPVQDPAPGPPFHRPHPPPEKDRGLRHQHEYHPADPSLPDPCLAMDDSDDEGEAATSREHTSRHRHPQQAWGDALPVEDGPDERLPHIHKQRGPPPGRPSRPIGE